MRAPRPALQPHPGLVLDASGTPFDPAFGDVFRSRDGGWIESQQVFVHGCALPERWRERERTVVLELGFGTGLNFLATAHAWHADPARSQRLHYVGIEARPLSSPDLRRALAALLPDTVAAADAGWLASFADQLVARWPPPIAGLHRLRFLDDGVVLTLVFRDAHEMLPALSLRADAIYLDGFAPSRNPQMWTPQVLRAVAALANEDCRLASWTAARPVRDALTEAGFDVERLAGVGHKRHRIVAHPTPGRWSRRHSRPEAVGLLDPQAPRKVLVIGAGLAGAAVVAGFARRGFDVELLDESATDQPRGSDQPICADHLHLSPDDNLLARLTRAALLLRRDEDVQTALVSRGRLNLLAPAADWESPMSAPGRAAPANAGSHLPPAFVRTLGPDEGGALAGIALPRGAIWLPRCLAVRPVELIASWLAAAGARLRRHDRIRVARLTRDAIDPDAAGAPLWQAWSADDRLIAEAPFVVLANAGDAPRLAGLRYLPLQPLAGQTTWLRAASLASLRTSLGAGVYATPSLDGSGSVLVGASAVNPGVLPDSMQDRANVDALAHALALEDGLQDARCATAGFGLRFATNDRLPCIGAVADEAVVRASLQAYVRNDRLPLPLQPGLLAATGFGARGLLWAALAGELLPAMACADPLPLERDLVEACSPLRFLRRALRRSQHREHELFGA